MIAMLFRETWRLLSFRPTGPELGTHRIAFLAFGLGFAWLAGIGRYWDNPRAEFWQHLGLGSVTYVFVLALILWLLVLPLQPRHWSYPNVLTFVCLTSPPALLYAIPVERFMSMDAARSANVWFLAIVALWRVALYATFLNRIARLSAAATITATLLPMAIIIIALSLLNLEHVVFNIMGGIMDADRSPNDAAYSVVFALSLLSFYATPALILVYLIQCFIAWGRKRMHPNESQSSG